MPVEEHAVHARVKITSNFRYGCHNRKTFKAGYIAFDRQYRPDGTFVVVQKFIEHRMSDKCCNFYLWDSHQHCEGCNTPKDEDYKKRMLAL